MVSLVRKKVLDSQKPQERVAHAQSCGDKDKTLEGDKHGTGR